MVASCKQWASVSFGKYIFTKNLPGAAFPPAESNEIPTMSPHTDQLQRPFAQLIGENPLLIPPIHHFSTWLQPC